VRAFLRFMLASVFYVVPWRRSICALGSSGSDERAHSSTDTPLPVIAVIALAVKSHRRDRVQSRHRFIQKQ
jgi:hypothetical protein